MVVAVVLLLLVAGSELLAGRWDAGDRAIMSWVRGQTGGAGALVTLAKGVTALGNDITLWIVTLLAAGYLFTARRMHDLAQLLTVTVSGGLLTTAVKAIGHRARPTIVDRLVAADGASFPSGHAMNSAFVCGTLGLIAASATTSSRERRYILGAAILLSGLIGATRIILGVHWPSDVLAGWAIGAGWATLGSQLRLRVAPTHGGGLQHDR